VCHQQASEVLALEDGVRVELLREAERLQKEQIKLQLMAAGVRKVRRVLGG